MCSVRLLIRAVRMAICTSGEPESESARRYCWINSRFRSLVTVIAGRDSSGLPLPAWRCENQVLLATQFLRQHGRRRGDESPYAVTLSETIPTKLERYDKPNNVSVQRGIARASPPKSPSDW